VEDGIEGVVVSNEERTSFRMIRRVGMKLRGRNELLDAVRPADGPVASVSRDSLHLEQLEQVVLRDDLGQALVGDDSRSAWSASDGPPP
jgi:hypothetical protein